MPFTREGQWVPPADKDIKAFRGAVEGSAVEEGSVLSPTPELVDAIKKVANTSVTNPEAKPKDFFKSISRINGAVDIIIPVYGGLHVLKECVKSVMERTTWDYRLTFVDDASPDPEVLEYLHTLDNVTVITNKQNRGFAATVNRGINSTHNPYVCILNSDVIVTEDWLTKMLVALESDPKNCIVNPTTNNTALINVDMYPGRSYLDMDMALGRQSVINYPEIMPTGFCFMYRRSLIDDIGPFDEAFGSYGEETDFWYRAINHVTDAGVLLGYKAVMADNCYLFHERGTSFSQLGETEHTKQRQAGSARFHKMHPGFGEWQKGFNVNDAVGGLRSQIPPRAFAKEHKGNVAWAVKSTGPCGGMFYIADIVNQMIEEGYNVKVCLVPDPPGS
jgi:GT2 family glycosyltransferase